MHIKSNLINVALCNVYNTIYRIINYVIYIYIYIADFKYLSFFLILLLVHLAMLRGYSWFVLWQFLEDYKKYWESNPRWAVYSKGHFWCNITPTSRFYKNIKLIFILCAKIMTLNKHCIEGKVLGHYWCNIYD